MVIKVKYINIIYHFVRDEICDKRIEIVKIDGIPNLVDELTKISHLETFRLYCATMHVLHKLLLLTTFAISI